MSNEAALMRRIMMKASELGWRLFRNNTGCYRKGKHFIRYGLCVGSSDLIGYTETGRFVAVEVKIDTPLTKEQANFLMQVIKSGGIGIVAHSVDDIDI